MEGTDVLRPTDGVEMEGNTYKVLPTKNYDPDDEKWKFLPGEIVFCEFEIRDNKKILVAKKLVK